MSGAAGRSSRRALVVARNLPPLRGGIERLMLHAVAELASEWDCDVLGPAGSAARLATASSVQELPSGYLPFLARGLAHVTLQPPRGYALCAASSGLMAPLARIAAGKNRCPYIVWLHGLDLTYGAAAYRAAFLPSIRAASHVIVNSRHTAELAAAAGIAAARITVIHPGVDEVEPVAPGVAAGLLQRLGLAGHPVLLFVGRLIERKGVAQFVERALPQVLRVNPDVRLLVVGAEPGRGGNASGPVRDLIRDAARRAGIESAVIVAGELDDTDLAAAYAAARVLVFPAISRPGDVEGFGMVMVEAAAHGVPAVAFALGGIPDAVSGRNGVLVEPENYAEFADAVSAVLRGAAACSPASCREHAQDYSWARYGAKLRELCRAVTGAPA